MLPMGEELEANQKQQDYVPLRNVLVMLRKEQSMTISRACAWPGAHTLHCIQAALGTLIEPLHVVQGKRRY